MFGRKKLLAKIDCQQKRITDMQRLIDEKSDKIRWLRCALERQKSRAAELEREVGRLTVKTEMLRPDQTESEVRGLAVVAVFEEWD